MLLHAPGPPARHVDRGDECCQRGSQLVRSLAGELALSLQSLMQAIK
jgi:hypothetical protein